MIILVVFIVMGIILVIYNIVCCFGVEDYLVILIVLGIGICGVVVVMGILL